MANFHLGQHLLFRKQAYAVTCHPAPGALQRPTLPLRDGPPFCSVLKMISMHEISWGACKLFPLLCIPVWIFRRLVSANLSDPVYTVHAWCQAAFVRVHILMLVFVWLSREFCSLHVRTRYGERHRTPALCKKLLCTAAELEKAT